LTPLHWPRLLARIITLVKSIDAMEKYRECGVIGHGSHGQVVLVQRCFRPRNRLDDEERTSSELRLLVDRINAKYPGAVDYEEVDGSRLTSGKRFGLWLASDVLLNTAVREGLNLDCFEFVYVKQEPGVIIASEFATTVSVLNGAIRINPFDIKALKSSLEEALCMSAAERGGRKERDIEYVVSRPSPQWTKQILYDMMFSDGAAGEGASASVYLADDAGLGGGRFTTGAGFSLLNAASVAEAYRATSRRVFIFDYSGTLRESERVSKYIKDDINPCHKVCLSPTLPLFFSPFCHFINHDAKKNKAEI